MLSPVEADTYMLLGANGYCYGNFPEGWRGDYDQFKTDWQQNGAHLPRTAGNRLNSNLVKVGRLVVKTLNDINNIQNAMNGGRFLVKKCKSLTK